MLRPSMISIVHAVACNTVHFIDGNILFSYLHDSVADPHHGEADPDPACHFDADLDLVPDLACHVDADPSFEIRLLTLTKC